MCISLRTAQQQQPTPETIITYDFIIHMMHESLCGGGGGLFRQLPRPEEPPASKRHVPRHQIASHTSRQRTLEGGLVLRCPRCWCLHWRSRVCVCVCVGRCYRSLLLHFCSHLVSLSQVGDYNLSTVNHYVWLAIYEPLSCKLAVERERDTRERLRVTTRIFINFVLNKLTHTWNWRVGSLWAFSFNLAEVWGATEKNLHVRVQPGYFIQCQANEYLLDG